MERGVRPRANEKHLRGAHQEESWDPAPEEQLSEEPTEDAGQQPVTHEEIGGYNWQASKSSLKERFSYLFNNEILSDVHFLVGKDPGAQRIPAHKLILTAGSAVFDAMFNGTLATRAPEVELPDVEPTAFLALLRYSHTIPCLLFCVCTNAHTHIYICIYINRQNYLP